MASWTNKQKAFVEEYCKDFNGTQAAIRAGYSERTADSQASRLLKDPDIKGAIDDYLDELAMSKREALKRLSDMGRADIANCIEVLENGDFKIDLPKAIREGKTHLIRKIKHTKYGTVVELHDPQAAIDKIMRARGAYQDRIDITSGNEPITGITVNVRTAGDDDG